MSNLTTLADRLDAAAADVGSLRERLAAGEPWALTEVYGPGPESAWGPREVLAHCAEMIPYWMGEIERILDGRGEPVPFGRVETDQLRVEIIGRDRTMPSRELVARIQSEGGRVARRVRQLTDDEAGWEGSHATRGPFSVEAIVERFIVTHLEGHVTQLRETLAAASR